MRYHNITKDDMLNGDGLRVVLWVAGCSHCCKGCQNPCTWDPNGGIPFDEAAKQEIFEQLDKPYISGITFSGGDPLHVANIQGVTDLMREISEKYPDKNIWCYTGASWDEVKKLSLMQYVNVLVDGEFEIDKKDATLLWKGSSNQKVINVQESLKKGSVVLHCGDHDDIPMGRQLEAACDCDGEDTIIPFLHNDLIVKQNA